MTWSSGLLSELFCHCLCKGIGGCFEETSTDQSFYLMCMLSKEGVVQVQAIAVVGGVEHCLVPIFHCFQFMRNDPQDRFHNIHPVLTLQCSDLLHVLVGSTSPYATA